MGNTAVIHVIKIETQYTIICNLVAKKLIIMYMYAKITKNCQDRHDVTSLASQ